MSNAEASSTTVELALYISELDNPHPTESNRGIVVVDEALVVSILLQSFVMLGWAESAKPNDDA
jgi:hypothetical protein